MDNVTQPLIAPLQEDEIDLRQLGLTLKKRWKFLVGLTVVSTIATTMFTLAQPNSYTSTAVLIPSVQDSSSKMGGLSALAGLAGVDLGGGKMSPDEGYKILLENKPFLYDLIKKYHLEIPLSSEADQNYHFALNNRTLYDTKKSFFGSPQPLLQDPEEKLFRLSEQLSKTIVIAGDKKAGTITISAVHSDPQVAKTLVDIFIKEASAQLMKTDMADLDKKLTYYQNEVNQISDATVKTQVSQLMTALIQTKVQAQASQYYNVKMITPPSVAYVKDKTGPKRGLIIAVAAITSLILGIFIVFAWEFFARPQDQEGS